MPAERFFVEGVLEGKVFLEGTEFHHLAHVMRVKVGEEIELVNGKGDLAIAQVEEIGKKGAQLEVIQKTSSSPLSSGLTLAVPLMRSSKLELVIEKCTELGADRFYLYPADHSEKETLSENQRERLQYIAISAMKQCGRLDLPPIEILGSLQEVLSKEGPFLFGDTREGAKPIEKIKGATFISGPEKGFSEKELKFLDQKGKGVKLHPYILRAETAPIFATCFFESLL
jgi:16S rRNA (uracil1498-N3)-methyltransferase